jgi:hypothetical protein
MNDRSNSNRGPATPADLAERLMRSVPVAEKQPMLLDGKAALGLYLAKIGDNAEALKAQAALLQKALQERLDLLKDLQSSKADDKDNK